MNRLMVLGILVWMGIALHAQSLYPDFSKLNFGCDGNSITAGEQWSKTVVGGACSEPRSRHMHSSLGDRVRP